MRNDSSALVSLTTFLPPVYIFRFIYWHINVRNNTYSACIQPFNLYVFVFVCYHKILIYNQIQNCLLQMPINLPHAHISYKVFRLNFIACCNELMFLCEGEKERWLLLIQQYSTNDTLNLKHIFRPWADHVLYLLLQFDANSRSGFFSLLFHLTFSLVSFGCRYKIAMRELHRSWNQCNNSFYSSYYSTNTWIL